tara:strand:+ start:858 stop:1355 length:498 start_codon:yes stop_codon:yes gene_type:complete
MFDISLLDNATLWVSTSFVIFVVITYNPLKKITNDALENKITELKKSLEESQALKIEAEKLYKSHLLKQKQNDERIRKIQNEANLEAKKIKENIQKEIDTNILRKKKNFDLVTSQMESQVKQELKKEIIRQTLIFTKIRIKKHLQKKHTNQLIEESLDKLSGHFS